MKQVLKNPRLQSLSAAILAVGLMTGASQSWASTAATATVRNIVTVNYANAAGTAQTALTAAVDVTVNLVPAAATLSAPTDITTAPGTAATYSYTITNGANGIATYNLSTAINSQTNISGSTAAPSAASVTLGASTVTTAVAIAAAGTTAIDVPRDGSADTSVNGIAAGDTIVIGAQVYTVASVVDAQVPAAPANGPYTTTITVNGNGTAQALTAGTLIQERQTFTMAVTPGSMTSTADATVDVTLTATNGTNPSSDTTVTTVASVGLSVTKLVRNVTTSAAGTGTAVTYGGADYYPSGVTGNPSEVLEYLIVVSKSSSSNNATSVSVTDPIPVFTSFLATAYGAASGLAIDNAGAGTFTNLTNVTDGDAAEFSGNNVVFRPGATAGTLGASASTRMKFQVTIQ
ncbi:MAG: hypothetical protein ACRERR_06135 [Moraxellaceae bacterium]